MLNNDSASSFVPERMFDQFSLINEVEEHGQKYWKVKRQYDRLKIKYDQLKRYCNEQINLASESEEVSYIRIENHEEENLNLKNEALGQIKEIIDKGRSKNKNGPCFLIDQSKYLEVLALLK